MKLLFYTTTLSTKKDIQSCRQALNGSRTHFPISKKETKDTSDGAESSGPWDAMIYMRDPIALTQIRSSADAWEAQELEVATVIPCC